MKKMGFFLWMLVMAMSCTLLSCSDDDNAPEPEPEVPPVVEPEPEPEPEPVIDTVVLWDQLVVQNWSTNREYRFGRFEYDTLGRLEKFEMSEEPCDMVREYAEYITVEWGDWGNKQVVMTYDEEGVAGQTCTATYTLNDKGWLEKVVVKKGNTKLEEYQVSYTDNSLTVNRVKTSGNERLYSASMDNGGRYGDWTVTEAEGATVKVDYEEYPDNEDIRKDLSGYMDVLLTTSYAGWLMPKCILWAHAAAMLPGQTKIYNNPVITYNGTTQDLYSMAVQALFTGTFWNISSFSNDDPSLAVWESSPSLLMVFERKAVTRPGKK